MNKPFVKLFSTLAGKYFYDVNKNEIIEITEEEYTYLFNMINHDSSFELLKDTQYINIKRLYDNGYFQATYPELIEHELTPYTKAYLSKRLQGITLQVTQNCNFKCRYCSFSGNGYFDRRHNGLKMDKSVAFKAVDFLKNNSVDLKEVRVGFYGGEPLLELQLNKRCCSLRQKKHAGKKVVVCNNHKFDAFDERNVGFFCRKQF